MGVGDFAAAVLAGANQAGVPLRAGTSVAWLSGWGHREPGAASAPPAVLERLATIHAALGGDAASLTLKQRRFPGMDFWVGGRVILELDEIQHLSSQRLTTVDHYEGLAHHVDLATYRLLCGRHQAAAGRAFAHKTSKDFAFAGGRTAQRAYLDAARDLLGPVFGARVVRVPAPLMHVGEAVAAIRGLWERGLLDV